MRASESPPSASSELNDLLIHPPIVGLSVEPTLGMSVVSLLANKHGVQVTARAVGSGPPRRGRPAGDAVRTDRRDRFARHRAGVERPRHSDARQARGLGTVPEFADTSVAGRRCPPNRLDRTRRRADPHARRRRFGVDVTIARRDRRDGRRRRGVRVPRRGIRRLARRGRRAARRRADIRARVVDRAGVVARRPSGRSRRIPLADAEPEAQEPAPELVAPGLTPPQSHDRLSGEFDRPPAPPAFGFEPASRPFTDPTARPIPARRSESEQHADAGHQTPFLPTRSRGTGPDGPDRLAAQLTGSHRPAHRVMPRRATRIRCKRRHPARSRRVRSGSPADSRRRRPSSRHPRPGAASFDHDEVTTSTSQSRLDPEVAP